jgi:fluoride ion exporter CrcB/FEX
MIWINALMGILGGAARACVGLIKASRTKTKIVWSKIFFSLVTSVIIGAATGLLFDSDYKISLVAGYIGTDLLENSIKIITKKIT